MKHSSSGKKKAIMLISLLVVISGSTPAITVFVLPIWHHLYDGGKYIAATIKKTWILTSGLTYVEQRPFIEGVDGHLDFTTTYHFERFVRTTTISIFGSFDNVQNGINLMNYSLSPISGILGIAQYFLTFRRNKDGNEKFFWVSDYPRFYVLKIGNAIKTYHFSWSGSLDFFKGFFEFRNF